MKIAINGEYLCKPLTGTQRYAFEIMREIDQLCNKGEILLLVPSFAREVPEYENIKVVRVPSLIKSSFFWIQTSLPFYLKRNKMKCIHLCNFVPFIKPDVVCLHDICHKVNPWLHSSFKERIVSQVVKINYRIATRKSIHIFTVSNFSKQQIAENYGVKKDKISLLSPGWQHMQRLVEDESIIDLFPELKKPYFFTLGSISKRKNISWVIEVARAHPQYIFAISGNQLPLQSKQVELENVPDNVKLLGKMNDEQMKYVMHHCKAFLFPSFYEGFGLPPLEALSLGRPIIVADRASIPEIYGKCAYYVNPEQTSINLDEILKETTQSPEEVINKYSWRKTAQKLYEFMHDYS